MSPGFRLFREGERNEEELAAVLSLGAFCLRARATAGRGDARDGDRKGLMMKNGVQVECSGDPYCDAQPFIECCPSVPMHGVFSGAFTTRGWGGAAALCAEPGQRR